MRALYQALNAFSLLMAGIALLSLVCPSLNAFMVDSLGPRYASITAPCGLFFAYLVFSTTTSISSLIAFWVYPVEFQTPRFPFYCLALTWAPLILLLIYGCILAASGKLVW